MIEGLKASDLRKGNVVMLTAYLENLPQAEYWLSYIDPWEINEVDAGRLIAKGIPLTEEWLDAIDNPIVNPIQGEIYWENDTIYISGYDRPENNFAAPCHFVHEYQNLIKILTRNEVQLKIPKI